MKLLIPLALAATAAASPLDLFNGLKANLQDVLTDFAVLSSSLFGLQTGPALGNLGQAFEQVKDVITQTEHRSAAWIQDGLKYIQQDGIIYETVALPEFPQHSLRLRSPQLCDPGVKQYSGYLDINEGSHSLFFWFFESRSNPSKDPLVLWLNGGPGCSSSTGLLFELGPCSVSDGGHNTTSNPHSWNTNANIIFLDQPVEVGYSYSSDGSSVSTSPVAAVDVWAFLELFLNRHKKYAALPFHLAAESYGGTYAPNIASVIHKKNSDLNTARSHNQVKINLASVILANGLTNPLIQFGKVAEYACEGPFPVFSPPDGPQCTALYSKTPTCERLIKACYSFNSRLTCVPAGLYCWSQLYGSFQQLGLNPYDVRRKCNRDKDKDGPLCYEQMQWIEVFMNEPKVKEELGASPNVEFESCSMKVNQAFTAQGDSMHNSALLLQDLLADGVKLLVYAGNADFMCNFMGNEAWMEDLDSVFQKEFLDAASETWMVASSGRPGGRVRAAGSDGQSAGNYTFVEVFNAGHMVPYDQPEAALDMITKWLHDERLGAAS